MVIGRIGGPKTRPSTVVGLKNLSFRNMGSGGKIISPQLGVLQQMEPELSDFAVHDIFDTSQFLENEKVYLAIYLLV